MLYPEKYIYDVPGHPKVLAKDLVNLLLEQTMQWNPTICLDQRVTDLKRRDDGLWELVTPDGGHVTKTVVITAGIGAFAPNKLALDDVNRFEGHSVYYFIKDKTLLRGKRLLIVGGGDSAVDWALNLKDYARQVTLIHRRDSSALRRGASPI